MQELFDDINQQIETAGNQSQEMRRLIHTIYRRFQTHHNMHLGDPKMLSLISPPGGPDLPGSKNLPQKLPHDTDRKAFRYQALFPPHCTARGTNFSQRPQRCQRLAENHPRPADSPDTQTLQRTFSTTLWPEANRTLSHHRKTSPGRPEKRHYATAAQYTAKSYFESSQHLAFK